MAITAECRTEDVTPLAEQLVRALEKLDSGDKEITLDFSSVRRLEGCALSVLANLAAKAETKSMKPVLCDVSPDVYKVLKLLDLTPCFSFVNRGN